jgi:hypothetical protein
MACPHPAAVILWVAVVDVHVLAAEMAKFEGTEAILIDALSSVDSFHLLG